MRHNFIAGQKAMFNRGAFETFTYSHYKSWARGMRIDTSLPVTVLTNTNGHGHTNIGVYSQGVYRDFLVDAEVLIPYPDTPFKEEDWL